MAQKFNNWQKAYIEFQKALGLPVVAIPNSIKDDLKIEYKPSVPVPQPIEKPAQNNITFKPSPSISTTTTKPSPKTRGQKEN